MHDRHPSSRAELAAEGCACPAAPPADFAPFPDWPNAPTEDDEASLFDKRLKPLRLGPGVYARGVQTLITGAEIMTSVSGGARCAESCVDVALNSLSRTSQCLVRHRVSMRTVKAMCC